MYPSFVATTIDRAWFSARLLPRTWKTRTVPTLCIQLYCHNMYPTVIDYAPPVDAHNHSSAFIRLPLNAVNKSRELCMANPQNFNYSIDMFQAAALDWLHATAAANEDPFFMYVSYTVPHAGGWQDRPEAGEQGQPVSWCVRWKPRPHADISAGAKGLWIHQQ